MTYCGFQIQVLVGIMYLDGFRDPFSSVFQFLQEKLFHLDQLDASQKIEASHVTDSTFPKHFQS